MRYLAFFFFYFLTWNEQNQSSKIWFNFFKIRNDYLLIEAFTSVFILLSVVQMKRISMSTERFCKFSVERMKEQNTDEDRMNMYKSRDCTNLIHHLCCSVPVLFFIWLVFSCETCLFFSLLLLIYSFFLLLHFVFIENLLIRIRIIWITKICVFDFVMHSIQLLLKWD